LLAVKSWYQFDKGQDLDPDELKSPVENRLDPQDLFSSMVQLKHGKCGNSGNDFGDINALKFHVINDAADMNTAAIMWLNSLCVDIDTGETGCRVIEIPVGHVQCALCK
jgi:hypothetical protein